jgi:hypothetical protein
LGKWISMGGYKLKKETIDWWFPFGNEVIIEYLKIFVGLFCP